MPDHRREEQTSPLSDILTLDDFKFDVPPSQVAQQPLTNRDEARLLFRKRAGGITHHIVKDLADLLPSTSLILVNDTKVFASRLFGQLGSGKKAEIFLLERPQGTEFAEAPALGRPQRNLELGTKIVFDENINATVVKSAHDGSALRVRFNRDASSLLEWLNQWGYVPLPPYIRRSMPLPVSQSEDRERYQTIYASHQGSVAAPTAGLHFTPALISTLKERGFKVLPVTLHVGAGTFLPVKSESIAEHRMHEEEFFVSSEVVRAIFEAKQKQQKIVAVGTTTLRCLESFYQKAGKDEDQLSVQADKWQKTNLFIHPNRRGDRYTPWAIDYLLTNYHQPGSTLFMLVCALIGYESACKMYEEAISREYRFFSYGDANLLEL